MTKLYIGNTSRQKLNFLFRLPEEGDIKRYSIQPGHQALVLDSSSDNVEYVIRQHETYGIKRASDVIRKKGFVGTCYSIDKPMTIQNFMVIDGQNHEALIEQGKETRANVATYAQASVASLVKQAGEDAKGLEIEIKDESKENPQFHEYFSAEKPVDMPGAKPRTRRARK